MEDVPKESSTIAAIRSARIAEKIRKAKQNFIVNKGFLSEGFIEILALFIVFIINFYLVQNYFGTASPDSFFSGPIVPLMSKFVSLFGPSASYSTQIVNIFFFLIFPFSYYFLVRLITGRKVIAIIALLLTMFPVYPFAYSRVIGSLEGIDSAHIASLSVIPIALHGLFSFLRYGGMDNLLIASLSSAVVALISPFGFLTYLIFAAISTFSEILVGKGRLKVSRFLVVLVFAGGLVAFWYNPAFFFWMIVGPLGEGLRTMVSRLVPILLFSLPILGTFGYLLFDRRPSLQPLFLASFFTIAFALITLAGGGFFPSHPSRYAPELGMSLGMLFGFLTVKVVEQLKKVNFEKLGFARFLGSGMMINISLALVGLALVSLTIILRGNILPDQNVLGFWTDVDKGEIWTEKDKFRGLSSYLGYGLSTFTILGLGLLTRKKWKETKLS